VVRTDGTRPAHLYGPPMSLAATLDRAYADPQRLREALAAREPAQSVEARETHVSWVFLVGERAYKRKKPGRVAGPVPGCLSRANRAPLDARGWRGLIREVHVDPRAEHVVMAPLLAIVDCVEFDPGPRALDIADDLAFLVIDLCARCSGSRQRGDRCLSPIRRGLRPRRAGLVLRRAESAHPGQDGAGAGPAADAEMLRLLEVAERCAKSGRGAPALAVCGVPASGKSTLAGRSVCLADAL
jgi:hypothetical protein